MRARRTRPQKQLAPFEAEAARLLESDPVFAAAVPQIVAGMDQLLADDPIPEGPELLQAMAHAFAARLRTPEYADWPDVFQQRLVPPDPQLAGRLFAADLAIGTAVGEFFGRNPGDRALTLADNILQVFPAAFRTFEVAAVAALREIPGGAESLDSVLRQRVADLVSVLEGALSTNRRIIGARPRRNRTRPRLMDTWEGGAGLQPVFIRDAFAYELLRRVDHRPYIAAVEALPDPGITQTVIETSAQYASLAELCLLLRAAGPAFDQNGVWIETSTAPFLLLSLCTDWLSGNAGAVDGAVEDTNTPSTASIADLMSEILDALAARQDGVPLGYAWLQYLIWSGRARNRWRKDVSTGAPPDLLTVLELLGAWLPPHSDPEGWVAEEQDLWRNDRTYSILTVALSKAETRRTAAEFVARVLTQDLVSSFGVERFAVDGGSHERHIIGAAIAAVPDPGTWFGELWAKLFHLRDRARRYRHGPGGRDLPNVGKVAVIWGLCALSFVDTASEASRALWSQLEAAARESILTDAVRLDNDAWDAALYWLGAYWPLTFPDDPPRGSVGSLDDFISFWAAPTSEFAILIAELHQDGVTIVQLKRSLQDGKLLRRGADALSRMRGVDLGSKTASTIRQIAHGLEA